MGIALVTGGSGGLGGDVVRTLLARGEAARVLTHRAGVAAANILPGVEVVVGDLRDAAGLGPALAGVTTIIHCAHNPREADFATDIQGAGNLTRQAAMSGVAHIVYISITGVDQSDYPYYAAKRQAERIIAAGVTPWTVLRAAQFHDLVYGLLRGWDTGAGRLRVAPDMRFQSVARREVAARLVALAAGAPLGYAPPMRGPETLTIAEMAAAYLAALGRAEPVEVLAAADAPPSVFRTGVNLLAEDTPATVGQETWAKYLRGAAHAERTAGPRP